jgi:plasmid maintenance system antidote protein VapI
MISIVREVLMKEKEISYLKLAYMIDTSPQRANALLKALAEIDDRVVYEKGKARWIKSEEATKG